VNLPLLPGQIPTVGTLQSHFRYGPDGQRYFQRMQPGAAIRDTRYDGPYERDRITGNGAGIDGYTEHRLTVTPGVVMTIRESSTGFAEPVFHYVHTDRLGSANVVVRGNGTIANSDSFGPFGEPRAANGLPTGVLHPTAGDSDFRYPPAMRRGFTDHEHLDRHALIHMNGRMYDYRLGRFLGVDPIVQFPTNSQSLNPYSYILNNPLAGTDPTGYETSCDGLSASDCKFELASGGASGGSRTYHIDRTSSENGSDRRAGVVGVSRRSSTPGEDDSWRLGGIDGRFGFSEHVEGPNGGSFVPTEDEREEAQREFENVRQSIANWQKDWQEDRPRRNAEAGEIAWRFAGEPIVSAVGLRALSFGLSKLALWSTGSAPATSNIVLRLGPKGVDPGHHNANIMIRGESGSVLSHERIVSGNMTAAEKALGFPRAQLASHTEARAVSGNSLKPGQTMTITGQRAPCPSCKGAMNRAAAESGATIRYQWRQDGATQIWIATPR
jgi:RHS repeat-associated protein